jgi:hypothetical protein
MNFSLRRLKENVFSTPIKDLLNIESERDGGRNLVTLSIKVDEQFTVDEYMLRERNSTQVVNHIFRITEDRLFKQIRNFIVKALVSQEPRNSDAPTHLFGLSYRVVDTEIEEGVVILLTPRMYHELRDQECESRQIVFTK